MKILEIQDSLMGESNAQGYPCTIIRLAGCNLNCSWCDTPTKNDEGKERTVEALVIEAKLRKRSKILITGGEPMLQSREVCLLIDELLNPNKKNSMNFDVYLETNGTVDISMLPTWETLHIIMDIKGPSSKITEKTYWANLNHLHFKDEVKFVVATQEDRTFVENCILKLPRLTEHIVVSPIYWPREQIGPLTVLKAGHPAEVTHSDFTKNIANWILTLKKPVRLQLQLHKLLGIA